MSTSNVVSVLEPAVTPPDEQFPKMGYFNKSMPSHTDLPPQKIAGTLTTLFRIFYL